MTTVPLKEPLTLRAVLLKGDQPLAAVRCRLTPPDEPTHGIALVPDDRDWLALGTLSLRVQQSGKQYMIVPTKLERAAGVPSLLRFDVGG
jgi:hypothetical protein